MTDKVRQLEKKIIEYIEDNQPSVAWGYPNDIGSNTLKELFKQGKEKFEDSLLEENLDYMAELENALRRNVLCEFEDEWKELGLDVEWVENICFKHTCVDLNLKDLYAQLPEFDVVLIGYRNTDCCNSIDDPFEVSSASYLGDVYSEIKYGVKRKDFAQEFYEGAYGGSLFMFGFRMDIDTFFELKKQSEEWNAYIKVPKGTPFGFHSSFSGACSMFEHKTHRAMWLKIKQNEYDEWDLVPDLQQGYSIAETCGQEMGFSNKADPEIEIVNGSNTKKEE